MKPAHRIGASATLALVAALATGPACATDGYFAHGYGMKGLGMGGAAIARTDDAFGGANNPAQFAFVDDRLEVGGTWFHPTRSASRSGSGLPAQAGNLDGSVESGSSSFLIPEMGLVHHMAPDWAVGITVYGNGGMNTDYPQGGFQCPTAVGPKPGNLLCGQGALGMDMSQLILAPTVAWKVDERQSLGLSALVTEQRFRATGLQAFANTPNFSASPANVTDNGYSYAHGVGLRVGYLIEISQVASFGLSYALKTSMSRFDKYRGLFAGEGGFDVPVHYGAGVALHPADRWTIALDYGRILYSGVPSVGTPSTNALGGAQLGAGNGPGFGWKDVSVVKLGAAFEVAQGVTLRAGINHGSNPISARDVTFNIIAPGVVQEHYTVGGTWAAGHASEFSFALAWMPEKSVTGSSLFNPLFQGQGLPAGSAGNETIRLGEKLLGLSWATKL
jgi:long-chain fatty acid transport protein